MIEEFVFAYHQNLEPKDFVQHGKRFYLNDRDKLALILSIKKLLSKRIDHTRIKKFGSRTQIKTIIKEEPIKLGQYIRNESPEYKPIMGTYLQYA